MPKIPLQLRGWQQMCQNYPDRAVADAIAGIVRFGARISFQGKREGQHIPKNHVSADQLPELLKENLCEQIDHDRLTIYQSAQTLPQNFYSSPLGLVNKPNGKKRRIHHLSHPPGKSVNDGIPIQFGEIHYSSVGEVITIIQELGEGAVMLKLDFADAFRQIPVSPLDTPLLGFSFDDYFYAERFLPFGLHTAPYIFNLFAEVFHWILEQQLQKICLNAHVMHYLDDFLVLLPPGTDWHPVSARFEQLAKLVG